MGLRIYNQQLKPRYNLRDEIDPISLNEIDVCNEWLVGQIDDDGEGAANELVFDDDRLSIGQWFMRLQGLKSVEPTLGEKLGKERNPKLEVVLWQQKKK